MRPGETAHDVHRAVSQGFTDRGYHLGHVTGHSIGMTMIEHPKIGEGVETLPLPELGLPAGHGDTRWRKLALFRRDLGGFAGATALFLDLDLVVVDDLGPFFDLPGDFRIIRDDVVVLELGTLNTLKRFKDEVNEVQSGQECGMHFQGFQDIKAGDYIECFTVEEVKRTLD